MTEFNDINLPADFDDLSKHAPLLDKLRVKGDGFSVPERYFAEAAELSVAGCQLSVVGNKTAGFTVPENYFEELAERIISIVNISIADNRQQTTDLSTETSVKVDNYFGVPDGYFEDLSERINAIVDLTDADNRQQTTDLSTETSVKVDNSFEVPEGYFNELDETLNTKLALDNLKQDEGFNIPDNYFEKLSGKIISRVAVDELNPGSDAEIPAGYFDTLADRITARIAEESTFAETSADKEKNRERGRIIVFAEVLKRYSRPLSIAASVTLLISVSIWFFNRGNNPQSDHLAKYVPAKQKFTPIVPALQDSDFVVTPKNENVAALDHPKHNSHHTINPEQDTNVKVQMADVMTQVDQMDENMMADYIHENSAVSNILQEKPSHEAVSDYIMDSNIDANDLINGINNQNP